jgi:hypothetical protein
MNPITIKSRDGVCELCGKTGISKMVVAHFSSKNARNTRRDPLGIENIPWCTAIKPMRRRRMRDSLKLGAHCAFNVRRAHFARYLPLWSTFMISDLIRRTFPEKFASYVGSESIMWRELSKDDTNTLFKSSGWRDIIRDCHKVFDFATSLEGENSSVGIDLRDAQALSIKMKAIPRSVVALSPRAKRIRIRKDATETSPPKRRRGRVILSDSEDE